jgi:hypothetical protein
MKGSPYRWAKVLAVLAFVANLGFVLVVSLVGQQARQDNCEKVADAFDIYNDILLGLAAGTERTPEEQARFDLAATELRTRTHEALADCS